VRVFVTGMGGDLGSRVAALLRAGELVYARRLPDPDVPVITVRTRGWELGRRWTVRFAVQSWSC